MRGSLAAAVLAAAIPSVAQSGELHLLGLVPYAYAVDVSADGRVVSGYDPGNVWYWTLDTWVVFVDGALPPGNGVGGSVLVTADGQRLMCSTLQGEPQKSEPTFWTIATQAFDPAVGSLGFNCDISRASPWGMSPDGRFVCGLVWDQGCNGKGYVWDSTTDAMVTLPSLYFYKPTRANAISNDGSLVAGWNDDYVGYRQGCIWRRDPAGNYVPTLMNTGVATAKLPEASACSGNGQWAYGGGRTSVNGGAPYRWSAATGYQAIAPAPPGEGTVQAANFDGSKLLTNFGASGAFVWFAERGYVPLATWAAENGVTLPPEWLLRGFDMTDDALTIVGHAIRTTDGAQAPYVLDLRPSAPPCPADLNDDGAVNGDDLGILLGNWGACASTDCPGDFDQNGSVDADDLGILLAAWGACPA